MNAPLDIRLVDLAPVFRKLGLFGIIGSAGPRMQTSGHGV